MVYVALLRGINVGGNNKIEMSRLKETFQGVGLMAVTTYINSGNVIFSDDKHSKTELATLLEAGIKKDFGLDIRVLIRSLEEYEELMAVLPKTWTNDAQRKSDVLFLWAEVDPTSVEAHLVTKPVDTVLLAPGAILWSVAREDVTKSGLQKIVGTRLYKQVTIRNVNSTRKIYEIMRETDHALEQTRRK